MDDLLSVAQAQERLLAFFSPLEEQLVSLDQAAERVLSRPVSAGVDLPLFANSSMDGFAVRAQDVRQTARSHPVRLLVIADVPAGQVAGKPVGPGEAIRIMTGGLLPEGADAVVPVEDSDFPSRQPGLAAPEAVRIFAPVRPGDNVRPAGQDLHRGEMVLPAGQRLRPQDLGMLAMLGEAQVPVHRRPRVAVFSSGDELLPVTQPLEPAKIHDSNTHTLIALVHQYGGETLDLGIARDQEQEVRRCLRQAVELRADLVLSSAGVSVGAFDFVRAVLEQEGRLEFWRVNMRPGKPFTFGQLGELPFIGLPGNPVSAFVGFEVFVRPAVQKMAGLPVRPRRVQKVRVLEPIESDGRESYLRAVVECVAEDCQARLTGHQGSGNLHSLVQANALLLVPSGVKFVPSGALVDAWLMDERY